MENNFENEDYSSNTTPPSYNENIPGPTQYDNYKHDVGFNDEHQGTLYSETKALSAFVLGILSVFTIISHPVLGLLPALAMAITGIILSTKGKGSKYDAFAKTGQILSIVALAILVVMLLQMLLFGSIVIKEIIANFSPYRYYFR